MTREGSTIELSISVKGLCHWFELLIEPSLILETPRELRDGFWRPLATNDFPDHDSANSIDTTVVPRLSPSLNFGTSL